MSATYSTERVGQRVAAPDRASRTARLATMAEAGSTALHVTRQGTLVAASSSLRVRIVAAGGATLHEGLLPGTAATHLAVGAHQRQQASWRDLGRDSGPSGMG